MNVSPLNDPTSVLARQAPFLVGSWRTIAEDPRVAENARSV
jgi:hypothetical protein